MSTAFQKTEFPKRYFSRVPGSNFTFPDGVQIHFLHGRFDFHPKDFPGNFISNNKEHPNNGKPRAEVYFDELEYLVKNNNPLVFEQGKLPDGLELPDGLNPAKNAQSESAIMQADAALAGKGKVHGELNVGTGQPTDVNSSSVDRELQKVVFGTTGPGSSKVEQLRAEAAQRTHQQAITAGAQNKNGMT
jgi:hypothetical protein